MHSVLFQSNIFSKLTKYFYSTQLTLINARNEVDQDKNIWLLSKNIWDQTTLQRQQTDLLTDALGDVLAHLPVHSLALLAVARGALLADLVLDRK